ncbi:phytanoyl-CoA dioxygenase family protein [Oceaniradius stylonematis]|uniref:phytanoyl-CoA dioxygenase family protein n=1 Tax=Oceaniradius stylonematis TaxID=2184161 RepID=UPI003C7A7D9B
MMMIPSFVRESSVFKIPLTYAHYGLIEYRRRRMARNDPAAVRSDSRLVAQALDELRERGWALLEGYIPSAECAAIRDRIDRLVDDAPDDLQSEYNGAEHRYFGAERLAASISAFHDDPLLESIASSYLETRTVNIATLAAKSMPADDDSRIRDRWHRDSFGRQVKALAYLSDVSEATGPFEFVDGSHRLARIVRDLHRGGLKLLQWRLSDEDVSRMKQRTGVESRKVVAPEGTVILVDTSCIHRAMPVADGIRYAITNYYVERGRYRPEIASALNVPYRPEEFDRDARNDQPERVR